MATATAGILLRAEYVDRVQAGLFFASVQEMKSDMQRQQVDTANLTIDDLGLFASPNKALRLSTIHYAKGRDTRPSQSSIYGPGPFHTSVPMTFQPRSACSTLP
jgi:hypothetical protein